MERRMSGRPEMMMMMRVTWATRRGIIEEMKGGKSGGGVEKRRTSGRWEAFLVMRMCLLQSSCSQSKHDVHVLVPDATLMVPQFEAT